MNEAQIIVTGNLANKPSLGTTPAGVSVANMRVGYTPRRFDRESGQWVDGQTSWLTVKCWRKLADNVAMCLDKGDPVVVRGVLQVRPYTDKDGNPRQAVEVLASAVGHDLTRGVAQFMRTGRKSGTVLMGGQGEAAAVDQPGAGAADSEAADGEAADREANGHSGVVRSVPGLPWEPPRNGAEAADDPDADMFDETAVVAAALHAVPDLEETSDGDGEPSRPANDGSSAAGDGSDSAGDRSGLPGDRSGRAGDGTGHRSDGNPGPDAQQAAAGPAPADRKPARVPAQRKAGTRQARRPGVTDGPDPAGDGHAAGSGTREGDRFDTGSGAGDGPGTGDSSSARDGSGDRGNDGAPAPKEPSLT